MRFGPVPLAEAEGAVLAHSLPTAAGKLGKGRVLTAADIAALRAAGHDPVTVARLDPGDVAEDAAAERLAAALVPDPAAAGLSLTRAHAGRVNLHATRPGVIEFDPATIHAVNRIDPALTFATLAPLTRVTPRLLCGTVKVITYAVPGAALDAAAAAARGQGGGAIGVRPVALRSASLLLTDAPGMPDKLVAKGRAAVAGRLSALGIALAETVRVAHAPEAIAAALGALTGDLILILTGAATSDIHDDAPAAVVAAGGRVTRFGMPVDPGNLLFLGALGARPVIGLPGCARSPAMNGADWVLERVACGLPVGEDEIAAMGVGGLLKEIPIRPRPREA